MALTSDFQFILAIAIAGLFLALIPGVYFIKTLEIIIKEWR